MARVLLENVSKTFREQKAVMDFCLEVVDKEFLVIVGPSGCGKTTVLRMIAGLEEASSGSIFIDNVRVNDMAPRDRNIAMVFQNYALYPNMTVYENLAFCLKVKKMKRDDIKKTVLTVAKMLNIEKYLDRKPAKLSGGERQRVAIGRALVRDPAVFLMDEPLSNLDARLRNLMRTELLRLHRQLQATFIYVTHDQTEAMTLGDRIAVMKQGIIQQVDTPDNIYNRPLNRFVAEFIGSPPMNFFSAMIEERDGRYFIDVVNNQTRLELPEQFKLDHSPIFQSEVVVGIRPEHIELRADCAINSLLSRIDIVEKMGSDVQLHMYLGQTPFIVKCRADRVVVPGMTVDLHFPPVSLHVFDSDSGLNLARPI